LPALHERPPRGVEYLPARRRQSRRHVVLPLADLAPVIAAKQLLVSRLRDQREREYNQYAVYDREATGGLHGCVPRGIDRTCRSSGMRIPSCCTMGPSCVRL